MRKEYCYMDQETVRWMKLAEMDYGVAEHLFKTYYPKPYEIICYHCQQAAEKAIKAIIMSGGAKGGLPKLHDLSFLLNQIKNTVKIEEKYYDYADALTPYGVSIRYPNELFLEESHAQKALEMARELLTWAKENVAQEEKGAKNE